MEVYGMKFAPLNIPVRRRLQTLVALLYAIIGLYGIPVGTLLAIYLILFTYLRWPTLLYLIWIWVIDKNVCENGGRRFNFMCQGVFWNYLKNYFPVYLEKASGVELDPKKNYLFCCFPHGVMFAATPVVFISEFNNVFPYHTEYSLTASLPLYVPFYRDLLLATGFCTASAKSINYLLKSPERGKVLVLNPGGAAEALISRSGQYNLFLRNRKGFVKIAIETGTPLVPVITFGETDIYSQVVSSKNSLLYKIQIAAKKLTGVAPVLPLGRGIFQYNYGIVPRREPVTCLVGRPIEIEKVTNPTQEQIDNIHEQFIEDLTTLFEEHKHRYIKKSENVKLNIV